MAPKAPPPLDIGDIAPRFTFPRQDGGEPFDSQADTVAGKPMISGHCPRCRNGPRGTTAGNARDIEASGAHAIAMTRRRRRTCRTG